MERETEDKYWNLRKDVAKYRGRIIDEVIIIEQAIDNIILKYFIKEDKVQDAYSMIFNNEYISFGAKEKILFTILAKPTYKEFMEKHKTLKKDIKNARELRNTLAHSKIHSTRDNIDNYDGNILPIFKDTLKGKEALGIRMDKLEAEIDALGRITIALWELMHIISPE